MHRPGCDPANMTPEDFLCDFCGQHWREDRPFVEGHRGACICGNCLTLAYHADPVEFDEPGLCCTMCRRPITGEPCWRSPAREVAVICRKCIKQSAGVLHKDPDVPWRKPG